MKVSLESIIQEAVCFEAAAFDEDQHVRGADLVDWIVKWRQRARAVARSTPCA